MHYMFNIKPVNDILLFGLTPLKLYHCYVQLRLTTVLLCNVCVHWGVNMTCILVRYAHKLCTFSMDFVCCNFIKQQNVFLVKPLLCLCL